MRFRFGVIAVSLEHDLQILRVGTRIAHDDRFFLPGGGRSAHQHEEHDGGSSSPCGKPKRPSRFGHCFLGRLAAEDSVHDALPQGGWGGGRRSKQG